VIQGCVAGGVIALARGGGLALGTGMLARAPALALALALALDVRRLRLSPAPAARPLGRPRRWLSWEQFGEGTPQH